MSLGGPSDPTVLDDFRLPDEHDDGGYKHTPLPVGNRADSRDDDMALESPGLGRRLSTTPPTDMSIAIPMYNLGIDDDLECFDMAVSGLSLSVGASDVLLSEESRGDLVSEDIQNPLERRAGVSFEPSMSTASSAGAEWSRAAKSLSSQELAEQQATLLTAMNAKLQALVGSFAKTTATASVQDEADNLGSSMSTLLESCCEAALQTVAQLREMRPVKQKGGKPWVRSKLGQLLDAPLAFYLLHRLSLGKSIGIGATAAKQDPASLEIVELLRRLLVWAAEAKGRRKASQIDDIWARRDKDMSLDLTWYDPALLPRGSVDVISSTP